MLVHRYQVTNVIRTATVDLSLTWFLHTAFGELVADLVRHALLLLLQGAHPNNTTCYGVPGSFLDSDSVDQYNTVQVPLQREQL